MPNQASNAVEEFPAPAREFLNYFYVARGVNSVKDRIRALREGYGLENACLVSDEGIKNDTEELRVLEFFVLTKVGILQ